jgi:hypothetical protein
MKRVLLAATVILAATTFLALGGEAVGMVKFGWRTASTEIASTETDMASRDHDMVVSAIDRMCPKNSVTTNHVDVLAPPVSNTHMSDSAESLVKPTPFQMAAMSYSAELKAQRVKLGQEVTAGESASWWYKAAIAAFGGLAAIMMGLRPLFDKYNRVSIGIATSAIIFSGTVGILSSVSAYSDAQARLLQHQRTLAQLQQLHWRVDNDVFAATLLCVDQHNTDLVKVGAWKDRLEEISDEAMPSLAKPEDLRKNPPPKDLPADPVAGKDKIVLTTSKN